MAYPTNEVSQFDEESRVGGTGRGGFLAQEAARQPPPVGPMSNLPLPSDEETIKMTPNDGPNSMQYNSFAVPPQVAHNRINMAGPPSSHRDRTLNTGDRL